MQWILGCKNVYRRIYKVKAQILGFMKRLTFFGGGWGMGDGGWGMGEAMAVLVLLYSLVVPDFCHHSLVQSD
ncbi:hypothetical protein [Serratia sp. CY85251]|uniref:hypothetical protein n=1 Tax=Serratia sp. CY85251 TaxID=3383696 RepID=UPI003FA08D17